MRRRWSLKVAGALYGALLLLLPRRERRGWSGAMRSEFAVLAEQSGAVWGTWLGCAADLVMNLPSAWRRRGGAGATERIGTMTMELLQAARALAKRPGFTLVTMLTLALGIGANVAIFAVVNSVLVKPLPYPEADRIVAVQHHAPGLGFETLENSPATLALYRDHAQSFSAVASAITSQRNLTGGREPVRVQVVQATPSLFDVLRVQVVLGRPLVPADAEPGASPVAVLSHAAWQTHFGGSRDVLGRTVLLDGASTEVVGVLPREYRYPSAETAMMLPMPTPADPEFGSFGALVTARLRDGVTIEAAQTEASALQARLTEIAELDSTWFRKAQWSVSLETLHQRTVGDAARTLWVVFGTVSFLLLVACASVANLFLVRADARQREIGIRLALGATRGRVAATFMYESLLLGIAGGVWGLALATVAVRVLVATGPAQLPRLDEVRIDAGVITFAALVTLGAGLLFGALPLLRRHSGVLSSLAGAARGATAERGRQRVRKALIVAQLALAIVLLTGSGLMLRSFQQLRAVDPGIRPENVLTVGISAGEGMTKMRSAALYQQIIDRVAAVPGVVQVGMTNALPLQPEALNGSSYFIESKPREPGALPPVAMFSAISAGFLDAVGTRVLAGRDIERADNEHGRAVVLINETFARAAFGDASPLGERLLFAQDSVWHEVVGVVQDVRITGARDEVRATAYLPMTTTVSSARTGLMQLAARTSGDPAMAALPIRQAIRDVDGELPLLSVRTMEEVVRESMAETAFTTMILMIASTVALLLGAVGLYGVIGYVVSQRTHEIGLRLALGALPQQVRSMVLRQGLDLAGLGVALGLAGAVALTRVLESLLFQVDSRDPLTFLTVPALLLAVAGIAAWLPARRASRVPPMQAMRGE